LVLAGGAILAARTAPAAVIQLSQMRDLEAHVSAAGSPNAPVSDGASESSDATGSFFRLMSYRVVGEAPPPSQTSAIAIASARQDVVIADAAIFGTLAAQAQVLHNGGGASASANSRWQTSFAVAEETPFNLSGTLRFISDGLGSTGRFVALFNLTGASPGGPNELILTAGGSGGNGGSDVPQPIAASGIFHTGWTYTLFAQLLGEKDIPFPGGAGQNKQFDGEINFTLTVPEPGAAIGLGILAAGTLLQRRRTPLTAASA
jgi:hypothetical protein